MNSNLTILLSAVHHETVAKMQKQMEEKQKEEKDKSKQKKNTVLVTFKDCDAFGMLDDHAKNRISDLVRKYIEYGEYVTLEFDTEAATCRVLTVKEANARYRKVESPSCESGEEEDDDESDEDEGNEVDEK